MALEAYRRMRDFRRTPEPEGGARDARADALSFVVQLHHARARHYDFRLEIDGVLHSWAVPKGPSLRPSDKRLAVEVEDHPLSYGHFAGEIPKGNYGAGHVAIFDRGTWVPEGDPAAGVAAGKLDFELHGGLLRGRWKLIRTGAARAGKAQWLLMKRKDGFAADLEADDLVGVAGGGAAPPKPTGARDAARTAKSPAPHRAQPPEPMLASSASAPPAGDGWLHEWKWDGYRMTARISGGRVRLWSRNGIEWTQRLPGIVAGLAALDVDAELDGELIALDEERHSSFNLLQAALESGDGTPLRYVVFDAMEIDGEPVHALPLLERKLRLRAILPEPPTAIVYSEHIVGQGARVFASARRLGLEGIMSKRVDAPYAPGRSRDWLKVKARDTRDFVVVGFTEPQGSRGGVGALLLAEAADGALRYAGRLGTGFSEPQRKALRAALAPLRRDDPPIALPPHVDLRARTVHWLRPERIVEVVFRGWGKEGLLRQPSFHRLREDAFHATEAAGATASKTADATTNRPAAAATPALTSPTRLVYPADRITKADVFAYYEAVAPRLLEDIGGRLLSVVRCPDGIEGEHFFQKHLGKGFGAAIHELAIAEAKGGRARYFHVDDRAGVLALAQMNALEFHPWGSTVGALERPDRIIIDLDPDPALPWAQVKAAAREVRDRLQALGLASVPRLTGGKGVHVVAHIAPVHDWQAVSGFCAAFAEALAQANPRRYVANMRKAERAGRIFIDWMRNRRGATAIANWSLRARPGAPVAMPVDWEELGRARSPARFHLRNARERLHDDPWAGAARGQALPLGADPA